MKINLLLSYIGLLCTTSLTAQTFNFKHLEVNNLKITIQSNGDMHRDTVLTTFTSETPAGSNTSTLGAQCLWMGGIDGNSELRLAANTYRQSGNDFWPGPVADTYDNIYDDIYNTVWHLHKIDIENHIANYNTAGYTVPASIETWPANGNTTNGEVQNLAPYQDINANDIYEPELGDYPLIRGDEALYVIYNDDKAIHTETGGQKIKAEIHHMLYAYNNPGHVNYNVVYSHYTIHNRSSFEFPNFFVSHWVDFSNTGAYGTHVPNNMIFSYDSLETSVFGPNSPAIGVKSLNHNLDYSIFYNNNNSALSGNPTMATEYYRYMIAQWRNSAQLANNGTTVSHMYPGDSDTTNYESWFDTYIPFSDRRSVSSITVPSFGPGEHICFDNAIIFAYDQTLTGLDQVQNLFTLSDQVQDFYDTQYDNCEDVSDLSLFEVFSLNGNNLSVEHENNTIVLELDVALDTDLNIKVIDITGRTVVQNTLKRGDISIQIELQKATPGTYFILCSNQSLNKSIKIIMP